MKIRLFVTLCHLAIFGLMAGRSAHAQCYAVGVPVCDSVTTITSYGGACTDVIETLTVSLDSTLIPYVTGLEFKLVITAVHGDVSSNVSGALKAGDELPLPAPVDSGNLFISLSTSSHFDFFLKIVGTPTVAGESYPAEIEAALTLAACNNLLSYSGTGQFCNVEPPTSVVEQIAAGSIPRELRLYQNYPNPFNPMTTIRFDVGKRSVVTLAIYDLRGTKVRTLVDEQLPPGAYTVEFDATGLASGLYFYRLEAGASVRVRKLTLLK